MAKKKAKPKAKRRSLVRKALDKVFPKTTYDMWDKERTDRKYYGALHTLLTMDKNMEAVRNEVAALRAEVNSLRAEVMVGKR